MTIIEMRIKIKPDTSEERIKKMGEHLQEFIYDEYEEMWEADMIQENPIEDVTYEIRDDYQE
jgi:hypothetical protein